MTDSWHSYPSIYALGHRGVANLFDGDVVVEEKVDGSQFSFGVFNGEIRCRSKGAIVHVDAPEGMFGRGVEVVKALAPILHDGWTYRGEYLQKPKHNALAYNRTPEKHIIIFDINTDFEAYLSPEAKAEEARRVGLEVVPLIAADHITDMTGFRSLLDRESVLGGPKIEGVVVKNYTQFGQDKKALMGKYVSEAFKEIHAHEWKNTNPNKGDVVQQLIMDYRTEARWQKAVQHLRERGEIDDSPRDIGKVMAEVGADIEKECAEQIAQALYKWAWPQIRRGTTAGVAEWYKSQLLASQFEPALIGSNFEAPYAD